MDNANSDNTWPEPEIIQAEVVEEMPGAPWEWREVRPVQPQRRWRLPLLLFVATCLSTLLVGTWDAAESVDGWAAALLLGLRYAVPVMTILLCHEMGHFLQARRHHVYASLPFFIPVPFPPFGTMGAVIAMEPRVGHRRALFDIGITGPLAGLVPTIIFCIWGLHCSELRPIPAHYHGIMVDSSILFQSLISWRFGSIPPNVMVDIDPMAFAGWVGLFITSLNLLPIGQLDGGHILYALIRQKARRVARLLLFAAVFMVVWKWQTLGPWSFMLFLLLLIGPNHPPTADDEEPLGVGRMILGWLTLAFIFIAFTPIPPQYVP